VRELVDGELERAPVGGDLGQRPPAVEERQQGALLGGELDVGERLGETRRAGASTVCAGPTSACNRRGRACAGCPRRSAPRPGRRVGSSRRARRCPGSRCSLPPPRRTANR
jgi:hypothetical protein